jgi:extracellular elastinolytic metalloproteinase
MRGTIFTKISGILALVLTFSVSAFAQNATQLPTALRYLEENHKKLGLTADDYSDVVVSDEYQSEKSQATYLYLMQRHDGIGVYNAIFNFAITKEGNVAHAGNRFIPNLDQKVNTSSPSLSAEAALSAALNHLGATGQTPELKQRIDENSYLFDKGTVSFRDITVALRYQPMADESVRLAWDIAIDLRSDDDYWSLRVDALTGEVLDQTSWTVHCSFAPGMYHNHDAECRDYREVAGTAQMETLGGSGYNVFAEVIGSNLFPHESPNHGDRNLIVDPAELTASPYGWHDTNGSAGAEFTITRGNNVHAYLDLDNDDIPAGDEPDGGADLLFDFPYNPTDEPEAFQDAAVTNLFFMNNFIHDFSYAYGFDEPAGNFQQNNYGNGGNAGDYVLAQAQDGGGTNNANFATPPDGGNGRMQMYLWGNTGGAQYLEVTEPSIVAGKYETGLTDGFGANIPNEGPWSGEVVIVDDGIIDPYVTDACEDIQNDITGKIALIDRGGCEFGFKALNAENAGAIGVIICNFEDALLTMGAGAVGAQVTIPVIMLSGPNCNLIRTFAGSTLEVTIAAPSVTGPNQLDGDLDNGIIAHEFAHGVSNRLTGGPSQAGCLGNTEQMGEGWSDFFSLVSSVKPGDTGDMRRGIGTYVTGEPTNGIGIRTYPYSTDLDNNPHSYSDAPGESVPHGVGSIWCAALWDMYWEFVDEYGFDEDLYYGTGGNNIAVQLVMEGMKLQPCSPGFVDGRDAILAADEILYNGVNQCLIWEAFARRGIGWVANQGSSNSVGDETEDFNPRPVCLAKMVIEKEVTPLIEAGDEIDVTIEVANYKPETVTNVVVTDDIPDGTSVVAGSISNGGTVDGNMVVWNLGDMELEDSYTLTYKLSTDPAEYSIRYLSDYLDTDDSEDNWIVENPFGFDIWFFSDDLDAYSGDYTWYVENTELENRQHLTYGEPITIQGDRPVMRVYHAFNTEPAGDGGLIQVSTDGGANWMELGDKMIRNPYTTELPYPGPFVIPNLSAFSGSSTIIPGNENGYIGTYIDMTEYAGQEVLIRFRFGSDDNTSPTTGTAGWWIDDFELMDMLSYNGTACVTTDQGDEECAQAAAEGTIVNSQLATSTQEIDANTQVTVFPNPASDLINVSLQSTEKEDIVVSLMTMDGREVEQRFAALNADQQLLTLDVRNLPSGFYLVKITNGTSTVIEKVVVE